MSDCLIVPIHADSFDVLVTYSDCSFRQSGASIGFMKDVVSLLIIVQSYESVNCQDYSRFH